MTVGRTASLLCHIKVSQDYKVAWIRVDTQTVLSFNEIVITKNHRIRVSHPEVNEWRLEISDVRRRDAGYYMCQVNTDPMRSQLAYLEVLEPPRITGTSGDQTVREGQDVVLRCDGEGHPQPTVKWRREERSNIRGLHGRYSPEVVGQVVSLTSVSRRDSGAYLCIATNRVPPAVSRRIILQVTCQCQRPHNQLSILSFQTLRLLWWRRRWSRSGLVIAPGWDARLKLSRTR